MCNILSHSFACTHTHTHARSRCNGTTHKLTSTGPKAACTSTPNLTIHLPILCGPCQRDHIESTWRGKLVRANAFLQCLRAFQHPSVRHVEALLKDLQDEHARAMWVANGSFARDCKPGVGRVRCGVFQRGRSRLGVEVRREDVVGSEDRKGWWEMGEGDYDGDYVASEDPLHPVCTEYVDYYVDDGEEADEADRGLGQELWDKQSVFEETSWDWGRDRGEKPPGTDGEETFESGGILDQLLWKPVETDAELEICGSLTGDDSMPTTSSLAKPTDSSHLDDESVRLFWSVANDSNNSIDIIQTVRDYNSSSRLDVLKSRLEGLELLDILDPQ